MPLNRADIGHHIQRDKPPVADSGSINTTTHIH
jgi:hypothetical protein